jgi:hypothetical protein
VKPPTVFLAEFPPFPEFTVNTRDIEIRPITAIPPQFAAK